MPDKSKQNRIAQSGFSLIEVVIVVIIIGILSAIAVPSFLDNVKRTKDRSRQIKLMLLRDAIERYVVEHDRSLPPGATEDEFKTEIMSYLPSDFPSLEVGHHDKQESFDPTGVQVVNSELALDGADKPAHAWKYNSTTGQIIINFNGPTALNPAINYDDW